MLQKIGQDSPSSGQFLKWDGSKAVWAAASGGAASEMEADNLTAGDAAVNITTTAGNVTIDSNAGNVKVDGHTGVEITSTNSGNITLDSVTGIV